MNLWASEEIERHEIIIEKTKKDQINKEKNIHFIFEFIFYVICSQITKLFRFFNDI